MAYEKRKRDYNLTLKPLRGSSRVQPPYSFCDDNRSNVIAHFEDGFIQIHSMIAGSISNILSLIRRNTIYNCLKVYIQLTEHDEKSWFYNIQTLSILGHES